MRIVDSDVKKELNKVRSYELEDSIDSYPEDEREGRTDMQILADECSYIVSNYTEDGHVLCEELEQSRRVLRKTKYGKEVPLVQESMKPVYTKIVIQRAKDCVNEYRRLQNLQKRLNAKGYYGQWQ